MPQLLTETDSLRLVPIVATCTAKKLLDHGSTILIREGATNTEPYSKPAVQGGAYASASRHCMLQASGGAYSH